jgi:hypothetical protein
VLCKRNRPFSNFLIHEKNINKFWIFFHIKMLYLEEHWSIKLIMQVCHCAANIWLPAAIEYFIIMTVPHIILSSNKIVLNASIFYMACSGNLCMVVSLSLILSVNSVFITINLSVKFFSDLVSQLSSFFSVFSVPLHFLSLSAF